MTPSIKTAPVNHREAKPLLQRYTAVSAGGRMGTRYTQLLWLQLFVCLQYTPLFYQNLNRSCRLHQAGRGSEAGEWPGPAYQVKTGSGDPRYPFVVALDSKKRAQGPRWCRRQAEWLSNRTVTRLGESLFWEQEVEECFWELLLAPRSCLDPKALLEE